MSNEDISWVVKVYWGKANREELYEGADWKNKWDNIADGRLAFESAIGTDSFYKVELIEIDCGEESVEDEWEEENGCFDCGRPLVSCRQYFNGENEVCSDCEEEEESDSE
jgi:hypothetical protein